MAASSPDIARSSRAMPQFGLSTYVWAPDKTEAFVLAKIVDIKSDKISVELVSEKGTARGGVHGRQNVKSFRYEDIFPAERVKGSGEAATLDDNCSLMFLNQATVLHNVHQRYKKDIVYTYVANILIAINPYKTIPQLYGLDNMRRYNGKSLGSVEPHVFAIGDKAYRDMKHGKVNQSIIVSGESGSGKTESVKYILKYLTSSYGHETGVIEERLIDSNPLLEAFGNAKTNRNNNSSRFGKFIELHFSKDFAIAGGYISHYLLERTRVCKQSRGERNYHIFYQLCCAADQSLRTKLEIGSPDKFDILRHGCTQYFLTVANDSRISGAAKSPDHLAHGPLYDIQLDDFESMQACFRAMGNMGMSEEMQLSVLTTVAAIMHLGNVKFENSAGDAADSGECVVTGPTRHSLNAASRMLQMNEEGLYRALTFREMKPKTTGGRSASVIFVPLNADGAIYARDALCKTIYVRLFDYLVKIVNESIPPSNRSSYYIGMLDIAGFEYFPINSFEQFCINYCNERLQQFFNARILRDEQSIYEYEGLGVRYIEYVDNQDCIDLIDARPNGILNLLDEESKLPQPSFTHFTGDVFSRNKKHPRLDLPRKSHLKLYREIRDDEGFLIRHFAGAVVYSTAEFIDKNNDAIHASLIAEVTSGTRSGFLKHLFEAHEDQTMAAGKLNFISVGNKFKEQLTELLERLVKTGTSFVRCVKPNENMRPAEFHGPNILTQLQCAGMLSVLELMQQGYPSRAKFSVLYGLYERYLPPDLARLDPRFFCKGLFACLKMTPGDYRFGLTMVFFRPGKFAEFDALMREDQEHLNYLVNQVRVWLRKARWRKAQYFMWSCIRIKKLMEDRQRKIMYLQATIRMILESRRHKYRIQGLFRLSRMLHALGDVPKSSLVTNQLQELYNEVMERGLNLRQTLLGHGDQGKVSREWIDSILGTYSNHIDSLLATAKTEEIAERKRNDERRQEQLRIQAEAEEKRKQTIAEETKRRLVEEESKRKEIEQRRMKDEELLRNRHELLARATAEEVKKKRDALLLRKKEEQSKIDYHLAKRLADDTGSDLDPMAIIGLPTTNDTGELERQRKYKLTSWKYAQLRDTINTSCNVELLQACREEFHRRLRAYHVWRARNKAKGSPIDRRVPEEITEAISNMRAIVGSEAVMDNEQRYFRVPLNDKPGEVSAWYAHFDGRWICRQLDVKDGRPMVAGIDDVDMCELRLDETDLTYRKGVEILESDFEKVWNEHGGMQYAIENFTKISSAYLRNATSKHLEIMEI